MIPKKQFLTPCILAFALVLLVFSCKEAKTQGASEIAIEESFNDSLGVQLVVLGTIQDAGSPQIGCARDCCKNLLENPDLTRNVVALGLADRRYQKNYLIEATPDIGQQLGAFNAITYSPPDRLPDGVFLTHAHIGHYTGLMYFGKEALNANKLPVYAMPRMRSFLAQNGPWGQLVLNENIRLAALKADQAKELTPSLKVTPFGVPHRDEYSETVGYLIEGPNKKALFIPDIDKWGRWDKSIIQAISEVDYALIDATFYDGEELDTRNISEIPHPFVIESMALFDELPASEKDKIYFIHFNHTNPLINTESEQYKAVIRNGYHAASFRQVLEL